MGRRVAPRHATEQRIAQPTRRPIAGTARRLAGLGWDLAGLARRAAAGGTGRPDRLAPSRPENAELGPVPASASPLAARDAVGNRFRRGLLIHSLLQHLPDLPPRTPRRGGTRLAGSARQWPAGR